MGAREKKQQVPPLRFAPVGMTILLQRSSISRWISFGHNRIVIPTGANAVEGPAVSFLGHSYLCGRSKADRVHRRECLASGLNREIDVGVGVSSTEECRFKL
jgi:hypothetical protein